jgi:hypothetical protein
MSAQLIIIDGPVRRRAESAADTVPQLPNTNFTGQDGLEQLPARFEGADVR